jgi:S-DNA-T family DNA segregation ATPase FtsK/SpoIIIE
VQAGTVALWVVDPKGGMELAGGRGLFARFCHGAPDQQRDGRSAVDVVSHELAYAEVLEDAVCVMRNRQAALRGVTRLHTPTPREPLVVIVVDELAALTGYVTDREAKKRIGAALALLLSQGRAVGVSVVAALQDPRKEVLPARDLFPTRVALRLSDDQQVDMVLGDGAHNRGATADRIPDTLPGVGYLTVDGASEPVRVRFSYLTDTDIASIADAYRRDPTGGGPVHEVERGAA